jgi:hypothetical protein
MRLVLTILCFMAGTCAFWVCFHPVKSNPTPSGVLASIKTGITTGKASTAAKETTSSSSSPLTDAVHDVESAADNARHDEAQGFDTLRHDVAHYGDDLLP